MTVSTDGVRNVFGFARLRDAQFLQFAPKEKACWRRCLLLGCSRPSGIPATPQGRGPASEETGWPRGSSTLACATLCHGPTDLSVAGIGQLPGKSHGVGGKRDGDATTYASGNSGGIFHTAAGGAAPRARARSWAVGSGGNSPHRAPRVGGILNCCLPPSMTDVIYHDFIA